jgi:two-component system invasion response regulator UvrY
MDVLVLDDHGMVAQAIAGVISEVAGCEVVGVCIAVPEACALIKQRRPQLLVLDVELADGSYCEPVAALLAANPEGRVLFVTALGEAFQPPTDLEPLTVGVIDKALAWDQLLAALERWRRSQVPRGQHGEAGCQLQLDAVERLSPRERRLVLELGRGLLNKQIAANLALSASTVETYRKTVAAKLGVSGPELVRLAALYRVFRWDGVTEPAG